MSPSGKNILVDTGEEENIILEYLLDRKIKTIDYLIISHFDSDHSGKAVEIIEKLNVKNIVISMQSEVSEQFEITIKSAQENKVNIIQVQAGDILKIDNEVYLDILWPKTDETIKENPLNNNSIVTKMRYGNFSVIFTGDIEKEAEEKILELYNERQLSATVLKVAHHGASTSSTEEFIKNVNPKISLIGVGKNNKFGHPTNTIIDRLNIYGIKTYRTDLHGEITLKVTKKGEIEIKTKL